MVAPICSVLVVDDDPDVAEVHVKLLRSLGYQATPQSNPDGVENQLIQCPELAMVMLDIRMPGISGLDLLKRIKLRTPGVGVVMATVINDIEHAVRAIKMGAYNYLLKPLQSERVGQVLESYFANQPKRLIADPRFSTFITGAPTFEEIFKRIRSFAEADVPVLVEGETGTGKELVARLVHTLSVRAGRRFEAVNVGALPANLFESELFGYARGAFTGALRDHAGFFEVAGEGTLFLDEIGELEPDQQKKLLRVIQEKVFRRIGETSERSLAARIVMATNRNLKAEVEAGRFREDLFYRLSSYRVLLPPLRARGGDVALLSSYFLGKYNSQFGRSIEGIHPAAIEALGRYAFPGNVRELEGIISGAVLLEQDRVIRLATLPQHVQRIEPGGEELQAIQRRTILKVLAECGGNQTRAAERLGISRPWLNKLLKGFAGDGTPSG